MRRLVLIPCLLAILVVAGCAQRYAPHGVSTSYAPTHYYPPPGPKSDPWGPYIREAAARYGLPEQWLRAVMAQESAGQEQAVSPVGAMGLMQIMPATYQELSAENALGADPFNPHDNILAGAAYIQRMYGRYGSPGFLAAYNAGPRRLDRYLAGEVGLPAETVHYVAVISPHLGTSVPMSGPLARFALASTAVRGSAPTAVSFATGCDVNAAFDPGHPCTSAMANKIAAIERSSAGSCDLDAAYNPNNPCVYRAPVQQAVIRPAATPDCDPNAAYNPGAPCIYAPTPVTGPPTFSGGVIANGSWAIQVGAFSTEELARNVVEGARAQLPDKFSNASIDLPPTEPFGGRVLYRARLTNLSQQAAATACSDLKARQLPCIVLPASAA
jgi:hypothetical protein